MEQKYLALHIASQDPVMESSVLTHLQREFNLEARIMVYPSEGIEARHIAEMAKPLIPTDYVTFLILDLFLTKAEIASLNAASNNAGELVWTPQKGELSERLGYYEIAGSDGKLQIHFGPNCLTSYQIFRHLVDVRHRPENLLVVFNRAKIKMPRSDIQDLAYYLFKDGHADWIYANSEENDNGQWLRGQMRRKLENLAEK